MDCSWSISSSNILDLHFMPVCVENHNTCWCLKISKNIVLFRWIISKKDCVMRYINLRLTYLLTMSVRWKLPTSTPKQPEQCRMSQSIAQQKAQEQVYNLDGLLMLCKTHLTFPEEFELEQLFLCANHVWVGEGMVACHILVVPSIVLRYLLNQMLTLYQYMPREVVY